MEFDPIFQEKMQYLSVGVFPEIKAKNPPMSQENNNTINFYMYQQTHFNNHFHHENYPLISNESNFNHADSHNHHHHHPAATNFFTDQGSSPSSILTTLFSLSPSSGDSSSSYKPMITYPNESLRGSFATNNNYYNPIMPYATNSTTLDEPMHGQPNGTIWDFSQKTPILSGAGHASASASAIAQPQQQVQRKSTARIQQKNMANIIKGQWSPDEDRILVQLVRRFGLKKWSHIAKVLRGRVGKQCRERWHNHLRPNIRKESWSEEEDKILIEAHKQVGNKWAEIARRLLGRTENTIKNHWNATKRRQKAKLLGNKRRSSRGEPTLLESYIRKVTAKEEATEKMAKLILKKSMSKMTLKGGESSGNSGHPYRVWYDSSEGGFTSEEDGEMQPAGDDEGNDGGGYVPMMVNNNGADVEDDDAMDYDIAMEMAPEVQMKKEMDIMEMIYRKA